MSSSTQNNQIKQLFLISGIALSDSSLVELNWITYDINLKESKFEDSNIIKPTDINNLKEQDNKIIIENEIEFNNCLNETAVSYKFFNKIKDLLNDSNDNININQIGFIFSKESIYNSILNLESLYLSNTNTNSKYINKNNCFYFDNIIDDYLSKKNNDKQNKDIKLTALLEELSTNSENKINSVLKYLNLSYKYNKTKCCTELYSIVRIINKLIKDDYAITFNNNYKIKNTTLVSITNNIVNGNNDNNEAISNTLNETKSLFKDNYFKPRFYYLKLKIYPAYTRKLPIKKILSQYNIEEEDDIVLGVNVINKFKGEYFIRLVDEYDYYEILSHMQYYIYKTDKEEEIIEAYISNEEEFILNKQSYNMLNCDLSTIEINDLNKDDHNNNSNHPKQYIKDSQVLKLSNLQNSVNEQDLRNALNNINSKSRETKFFVPSSGIVLGEDCFNENREIKDNKEFSIEAIVILANEAQASEFTNNLPIFKKLSTKLSQVKIFKSSFEEYERFLSLDVKKHIIKNINTLLSVEQVNKSLLISNIPIYATKEEVLEVFGFLNIGECNLIFPNNFIFSFGCLVVDLDSEDLCEIAISLIDKEKFYFKAMNNDTICRTLKVESILSIINHRK